MKFANNSERKAYWTVMMDNYSAARIEEALQRMPPDTALVTTTLLHEISLQRNCHHHE